MNLRVVARVFTVIHQVLLFRWLLNEAGPTEGIRGPLLDLFAVSPLASRPEALGPFARILEKLRAEKEGGPKYTAKRGNAFANSEEEMGTTESAEGGEETKAEEEGEKE